MTIPPNGTPPRSPQPAPGSPVRMRACDAEREAVVRQLHDAVARGQLTLAEGDDRMAAAYASRFVDELESLTADLPPAPAVAPATPHWRALVTALVLAARTALATVPAAVRHRPRVAIVMLALLVLGVIGVVGTSELVAMSGHLPGD